MTATPTKTAPAAPAAAAAPAPPVAPAKPKSKLGLVQRGRIASPVIRAFIYGPEGVGKTTLASDAPDAIGFDLEDGSKHLDVARYKFRDEEGGHVAKSYEEVLDGLRDLYVSDHPYRSLWIDPVDRLEALLWSWMLERDKKKTSKKNESDLDSIESYGFGKGYAFALDEWRHFCSLLDRLHTEKRMSIVLVGHATVRTWKNPEGPDFDRYTSRLNDKAAGFLREWSDLVGFFTYEQIVDVETDKRGRAKGRPKGMSTGRRLLHTERTASYDAKSRIPMAAAIEVPETSPWSLVQAAILEGQAASPDSIVDQIKAEVERIGDAELAERVRAAVVAAVAKKDVDSLYRYLNSLRRRDAAAE